MSPSRHLLLLAGLAGVFAAGCSHTVEINSEPTGARVFVDGEDRGTTPIELEESSGFFDSHHVRVEKDGFAAVEAQIVQAEPIWAILGPSVCLAPLTLGLSCFGVAYSMRYAQSYEYRLSPALIDGDGGTIPEGPDISDVDEDKDAAIPY